MAVKETQEFLELLDVLGSAIEEIKDESQLAVEGGVNHLGDRRLRGGGTCGTTASDEPLCQGDEGAALCLTKDARRRRIGRRGP